MSTFTVILDILAYGISLFARTPVRLHKKEPLPHMALPDHNPVKPVPSTLVSNPYRLSARSKTELLGVHPKLVELVSHAIQISAVDFMVFDGKRTAEEQNRHFRNKASQLDGYKKKSYHQSGNAVDLVPVINGKENHTDWDNYYVLASAMVTAAKELGIANKIRWGGAWDRRLNQLSADPARLKAAVHSYSARRKKAGAKSVFLDGPHFEWRG